MSRYLSSLKQRLATVPEEGLRYRFVHYFFEKKVRRTKACTFYWVLMPSSVVLSILLGACTVAVTIAMSAWTIFVWLLGFYPTVIRNKVDKEYVGGKQIYVTNSESLYYSYGYHPWSGKFARIQPFMVVIAVASSTGLVRAITGGQVLSTVSGFVHWVSAEKWWLMSAVGLLLIFYIVGQLISRYRRDISVAWGKVCPDLKIVHQSDRTSQTATN